MPIKAKSIDVPVHIDPLSLTASLEILTGNNAQTYNVETKEYIPDRSVYPCEIIPAVSVIDPEGVMFGVQTISSCEWFEGDKRITSGADYDVSQSSLIIKKNVSQDHPIEIRCLYTFTDLRSNKVVQVERSMPFYTAVYDNSMLHLVVDKPRSMSIDPLTLSRNDGDTWPITLNAQLFSGKLALPDSEVAYWWQIFDYVSNRWRDFTDEELDIMLINPKDELGHFKKTLTIDLRFIGAASIRCFATQYKNNYPNLLTSSSIRESITIRVELPNSLKAEIVQTEGVKVNSSLSNKVSFLCRISDGHGIILEDKMFLFSIRWWLISSAPGFSKCYLGLGPKISFVPQDYNLDNQYPFEVGADVAIFKKMAPVTDVNGKLIISSNKFIINTIYK